MIKEYKIGFVKPCSLEREFVESLIDGEDKDVILSDFGVYVIKKFDYTIKTAEERLVLVEKLIKEFNDKVGFDFLEKYISTIYFNNTNILKKGDGGNVEFRNIMSAISYYLDYTFQPHGRRPAGMKAPNTLTKEKLKRIKENEVVFSELLKDLSSGSDEDSTDTESLILENAMRNNKVIFVGKSKERINKKVFEENYKNNYVKESNCFVENSNSHVDMDVYDVFHESNKQYNEVLRNLNIQLENETDKKKQSKIKGMIRDINSDKALMTVQLQKPLDNFSKKSITNPKADFNNPFYAVAQERVVKTEVSEENVKVKATYGKLIKKERDAFNLFDEVYVSNMIDCYGGIEASIEKMGYAFEDDMMYLLLDFKEIVSKAKEWHMLNEKETKELDYMLGTYEGMFGEDVEDLKGDKKSKLNIVKKLIKANTLLEYAKLNEIEIYMKECKCCEKSKPANIGTFYQIDKTGKDGYRANCNECVNKIRAK